MTALTSATLAVWKPAAAPLMTRWAKEVSPTNVHPEYPRPQMRRERWMNLNGLWELATKENDFSQQILVPFPIESALSGVGKHADHFWYRRAIELPKDYDHRVLLHFGAVDYDATVYVNGEKLGSHRGGYDSFSFDITDALKKKGPQEIVVEVIDKTEASQARGKQTSDPKGIFYTPVSGIWQTVWIEPVAEEHADYVSITPDVDAGGVRIRVSASSDAPVEVRVTDDGKSIARADAKANQEFLVKIPNAHLWSPDDPHLYDLHLAIGKGDKIESYFAMRKISVASDGKYQRIMLNDKPVFQVGPLDQGFWPDGIYTAPTDAAMKYDLQMTKKLGFNMIRKHVKVEPQTWYAACDRLGILVWQDMPSAYELKTDEQKKQFEHEMERMIHEHHNSPCIVTWVVFNEGWGQYDTKRITDWVKQLDPSRLANNASGWTDAGAGDMNDMHKYPGPGMPAPEKNRAVVLGEFGGLGLGVDGHHWSQKTWGYRGMESREELTNQYVQLYKRLWQLQAEGLSASVYTQTTDVETECNGLMTYDREILKVDAEKIRAANTGMIARLQIVPVVPTAQTQKIEWQYSLEKPVSGWQKPGFDDSQWKTGLAGFGTEGTPGAVIGTTWNTSDIWLRRSFDLPAGDYRNLLLTIHHDEDAEVHINGVLATQKKRYTDNYVEEHIMEKALATLKPGTNTIAVHCHQTTGGQYIDVGFVQYIEKPASK